MVWNIVAVALIVLVGIVLVHPRVLGAFRRFDARIHVREQTAHRRDIAHPGNVVQVHGLGGEQRRRHGRQRGIFCAADAHRAAQPPAAFDSESVHKIVPAPMEANER